MCSASPRTALAFADRKSTRLNSSHTVISYAVFCLQKKTNSHAQDAIQRRAALTYTPRSAPRHIATRQRSTLFFYSYVHLRDLLSFPTRRSSDLNSSPTTPVSGTIART